ncbi:MAG: hypothetical protein O3B87_00075 [bacterium]|nr:hypothetical protein [bacterium]
MIQKDLLAIIITIFLTIIAWVIIELNGISQATPTESDVEAVSLNYTIDTTLLDILEKRTP